MFIFAELLLVSILSESDTRSIPFFSFLLYPFSSSSAFTS